MWDAIKAMLASKKFLATLAGVVVTLLGRLSFDIDPETIYGILAAIAAYVLGQGLADFGKYSSANSNAGQGGGS